MIKSTTESHKNFRIFYMTPKGLRKVHLSARNENWAKEDFRRMKGDTPIVMITRLNEVGAVIG